MKLVAIHPNDVPRYWPLAKPMLARSLARAPTEEHTLVSLEDECRANTMQLVLICPDDPSKPPVAAGVTQVRVYANNSRAMWIIALGGSGAREWRDTLRWLEIGAKMAGCDRLHFNGRPGWAALLPDYACVAHFEKDLT